MPAKYDVPKKAPDLIHPAFDIRPDLISFGFEVEVTSDDGTLKRKPIFVFGDGTTVEMGTGTKFAVDGTSYERRRHKRLPLLDDQWERLNLFDFCDDPQCLAPRRLYHEIRASWERHLDFDDDGEFVIVACWTALTYVYRLFPAVPYLHFLGPKGCGKSQALDLDEMITRRGHKSRVTPAVLGDLIEAWRVTPLFDQSDNLTPEHVDLFASSYRVGAKRTIVDMDNRGVPMEFDLFGPKAFAGTQYLDEDLADRAILITMSPAARQVAPVVPTDPTFARLRAECYRWAMLNGPGITQCKPFRPSWPPLAEFTDRQRELWLPMECMMEVLDVPETEREAARDYYRRSQTATKAELPEDQAELLTVIRDLVGDDAELTITSTELAAHLSILWDKRVTGRLLSSLNLVLKNERAASRRERIYVLDGATVRSKCARFGLTE